MNTLLRAIVTVVLLAVLAAVPVTRPGAASQGAADPVAVEIDGDPILRLAGSSPDATVQVVLGQATYQREAGAEWQRIGDEPPPGAVVFAADDPAVLLAGDHPPCLRGGTGSPLERSRDGGASWVSVDGVDALRPLAIWNESGVALGATCSGMMLSTDAGQTWTDLAAVEAGYEITAFATATPASASAGPVVLFGMTSEGGTSRLYRLDLTDPAAPELSEPLREYWGVAGVAAREDSYVLAAADGVWVSNDAGASWDRSAEGLEDVVLDADPVQAGLPAGVEAGSFGLYAAAFLDAESDALVLGSANGLYTAGNTAGPWTPVDGTDGEIRQIHAIGDAGPVLYVADDMVFDVTLAASEAGGPRQGTVEPAREAAPKTAPVSG